MWARRNRRRAGRHLPEHRAQPISSTLAAGKTTQLTFKLSFHTLQISVLALGWLTSATAYLTCKDGMMKGSQRHFGSQQLSQFKAS